MGYMTYGPRGTLRRTAASTAGALAAAGRAAYRARFGTARTTRSRGRFGGSSTRTRTRRRGQSGVGVTKENDVRFVYGKRRMPARRRRAWKRFTRKVYAVSEKQRGTQSLAFNTVKQENVPEGFQRMYGIELYGYNGSTSAQDAYSSDMAQIAGLTKPGDAAVAPLTYNRKVHFRSAVLDITFRNIGSTQVELDIYEYIVKKDIPFVRMIDMILDAQTDAQAVAPVSSTLTHDDVGVTPFQISAAMRYITITKKTKVFLSTTDGVATYQIRKPANRWWSTTQLNEDLSTFAKRSWTVGILLVQKGVPGFLTPNPIRAQASNVVMSITRTYTLKTVDNQEFNVSGFQQS